ncbi:Uncharacterised protein [Mycobacterium tuberculosis]|uniref:Uncharacterized protein n=1 Tax=Mycobacterium tuberculosis TaxID=1773 RepID=A0A655A021_MYCTX|nr:Uncharacterised protein [Mycobacterium tuberculosis]CKR74143.1 Uncharacterised protein [Mycobacterium tuberculosis]CKS74709.1 Uncharacterised protein [Mycobacterium tuberculosis]CKS76329.1 Uncharacterised protein [Mycobacterium tuberculosis]CKT68166.1 Uncharacterised protein [Mycobacterium tuberculosis]
MRATPRASVLSWSSVATIDEIRSDWPTSASWVAIWKARCPGISQWATRRTLVSGW